MNGVIGPARYHEILLQAYTSSHAFLPACTTFFHVRFGPLLLFAWSRNSVRALYCDA
jgi:hypothetical protein